MVGDGGEEGRRGRAGVAAGIRGTAGESKSQSSFKARLTRPAERVCQFNSFIQPVFSE